jgi:hypothetical protein
VDLGILTNQGSNNWSSDEKTVNIDYTILTDAKCRISSQYSDPTDNNNKCRLKHKTKESYIPYVVRVLCDSGNRVLEKENADYVLPAEQNSITLEIKAGIIGVLGKDFLPGNYKDRLTLTIAG